MNTTDGIETVLARHRLYGDSDYGDDIVCGCDSTPPTDALEADRGEVRWHETHVADAIAAHLLSDAVELRAARAVLDARRHRWDTEPHQGECITDARAALAAAVGGDTE